MIDKRLLTLQKNELSKIAVVVGARLGALILAIAFYYLMANTLVQVFDHKLSPATFIRLSLYTGIVAFLKIGLNRLSAASAFASSARLRLTIRNQVLAKVFRMGPMVSNVISPAELTQISVEGIEQLEVYYSRFIPQFFYSLAASLLVFATLAYFQLEAALVLLLCVPLIPISIVLIMKIAKKVLSKYWGDYLNLGDVFYENLQGLTTLKIYQQDAAQHKKMNQLAEDFRLATMRLLTMQLNSITVMDIIAYSGAGVGISLALLAYQRGSLTLLGMLMFILLSAEFFIPLRQLGSLFHVAMTGISATDRLFNFLDLPEQGNLDNYTEAASPVTTIQVEQLTYTYPNETTTSLQDVSLTFKRGQFTAIIGKSGSGKSTLGMILAGFYADYQGTITLDGTALERLSKTAHFNQVELVSNKGFLFPQSLRKNLMLGNDHLTETQLWDVLKKVNLTSFVQSLPQQLDFVLSERGANLSGGQKQRLLLARSLLQNKDIFIFDEITSNIDLTSEKIIMHELKQLAQEKMVIFISHRLYNIMDAEQVIVFESGKVVEFGSPSVLKQASHYFKNYLNDEQTLLAGHEGKLNEN